MELRKVCNHAYLIDDTIDKEEEKIGAYNGNHESKQALAEFYASNSCKMQFLHTVLLPRLRKDGHRVLIFSQFVKMLDILVRCLSS